MNARVWGSAVCVLVLLVCYWLYPRGHQATVEDLMPEADNRSSELDFFVDGVAVDQPLALPVNEEHEIRFELAQTDSPLRNGAGVKLMVADGQGFLVINSTSFLPTKKSNKLVGRLNWTIKNYYEGDIVLMISCFGRDRTPIARVPVTLVK